MSEPDVDSGRSQASSEPGSRLLAISPVPLWPDANGYSLRVVNLLRELAHDWEIVLVAAASPASEDRTESLGLSNHYSVPSRGNIATMPWQLDLSPLERVAGDLSREQAFDAAITWAGAEPVATHLHVSIAIADRIDCATLANLRDFSAAAAVRERFRLLRAAVRAAHFERHMVRTLDGITVVSPEDAQVLQRVSGRNNVFIVPNGVRAESSPNPQLESDRPIITFTGALGFPPNASAAKYFAQEIMPRVLTRFPDARFVIAGWGDEPEVIDLGALPGVEIRQSVPDLADVLRPTWVSVAPMVSGCGIKNKVLDAWAFGKPVVMSSLAARGLSEWTVEGGVVADDPEEFAAQVIGLLEDRDERIRLGRSGFEYVREHYEWSRSAESMSSIIRQLSKRRQLGRGATPIAEHPSARESHSDARTVDSSR